MQINDVNSAPTMELDLWWNELERLTRALGHSGPDEVCCAGLTVRQCAILRTLVAGEGARLQDLARSSGITPSAMTRVLERLEARGLVKRVRGAHQDRRAAMVAITAAGRRVRSRIDDLMRERTRAILALVPPAERAQVFAALDVLNGALERIGCCAFNGPAERPELVKITEPDQLLNLKRKKPPKPRT